MRRFTFDKNSQDGWKSYPIRLTGQDVSDCCSKPTILVQSMPGGFVTMNCSACGQKDTLSNSDFGRLPVWVSCPDCRKKMEPAIMIDKNYAYCCDACQLFILLADLLPHWQDLFKGEK